MHFWPIGRGGFLGVTDWSLSVRMGDFGCQKQEGDISSSPRSKKQVRVPCVLANVWSASELFPSSFFLVAGVFQMGQVQPTATEATGGHPACNPPRGVLPPASPGGGVPIPPGPPGPPPPSAPRLPRPPRGLASPGTLPGLPVHTEGSPEVHRAVPCLWTMAGEHKCGVFLRG